MSGPTLPVIDRSDRWLRQSGRVVALGDGVAEVAVDKAAACGGCATSKACGVKALIQMRGSGADAPARITMHPNQLARQARAEPALHVGTGVSVAMPAEDFVQAAVLAFLLPPLALVLAISVNVWANIAGWSALLLYSGAFGLAFVPLIRTERRGMLLRGLRIEPAERT